MKVKGSALQAQTHVLIWYYYIPLSVSGNCKVLSVWWQKKKRRSMSKCVCLSAFAFLHGSAAQTYVELHVGGSSGVPCKRSLKLLRENRGSKRNIFSLQKHSCEVHVKCVFLSALLSSWGFLCIVELLGFKQYAAHTIYRMYVSVF